MQLVDIAFSKSARSLAACEFESHQGYMAYRGSLGFEYQPLVNPKTHKVDKYRASVVCEKCKVSITATDKTMAKADQIMFRKIDAHINKNPKNH